MNIKPIETVYNGYRFRSRLEARWAVFFDSVGILYQYEPDGFSIGTGKGSKKWYLPDFFLSDPAYDFYVEVKPNNTNRAEICDFMQYAHEALNKPILLCFGDPAEDDLLYCTHAVNDSGGGFCTFKAVFATRCFMGYSPFLVADLQNMKDLMSGDWSTCETKARPAVQAVHNPIFESLTKRMIQTEGAMLESRVFRAKELARGMRFEHDENTFKHRPMPLQTDWRY